MRTLRIFLVACALAVASALGLALNSFAAGQPTATSSAPTNVTPTSATANGSVNPNGNATQYAFQYGPTNQYGEETGLQSAGSGTTAQNVSATLNGIKAGYHYRVVALSSAGTVVGADETVGSGNPANGPKAPTSNTGGSGPIGSDNATVSGSVDPKGLPTTYHYEYGTTPNFGQSTSNANAGSGTTPADTNAGLGSLPTNTRIYYRLVSDNADGQSIGSTNSFQTQPAPQGGPTPGVNVYAHTGFVSPHTPIVGIFVANLQNTKESSTLSIAHGNTTIASRHFTLAPGAAGFVHITLTKTGLHDLHVYQGRHQLLSVQAHIAGTKINHYLGLAEWGYSGVK